MNQTGLTVAQHVPLVNLEPQPVPIIRCPILGYSLTARTDQPAIDKLIAHAKRLRQRAHEAIITEISSGRYDSSRRARLTFAHRALSKCIETMIWHQADLEFKAWTVQA